MILQYGAEQILFQGNYTPLATTLGNNFFSIYNITLNCNYSYFHITKLY